MGINQTINSIGLSDFEVLAYPQSQPDQKKVDCNAKVRGADDLSETKETSQSAQKSSQSNIPPDLDVEIVSVDFLADAEVEPGVAKTLEQQLQHAVKERHTIGNSIKNFFKKCGRGIMNAFSAIRGARSFYHAKSVAHFNSALNVTDHGSTEERSGWKKSIDYDKAVSYSDKELAAASGLRGNVEVKKFTADQIQSIADGHFSLADIKQDPGLQDCWFLSSLGAFLAKGGSGSLSDLIHIPAGENNQPPEHAYVKLGTDVYKVPLGIVTGGGKKNISDSAPWVNLLETAMQMHLIKHTNHDDVSTTGPRMSERNVQDAFAALQGVKHNGFRSASVNVKATLSKVHAFFETGCPVVLGSPKDAPFFALSTGISPGHAVTVVGVEQGKRPGDGRVTVLDPYGHTTVINEKDLQQFDMIAATPERSEKCIEADEMFDLADKCRGTDPKLCEVLLNKARDVQDTIGTDEAEVVAAQKKLEIKDEIKDREELRNLAATLSNDGPKTVTHYKQEDLRSVLLLLRTLTSFESDSNLGFANFVKQNILDMMPAALKRIRNEGKKGDVTLQDWWKALGLKGNAPKEGVSAVEAGTALLKALYNKVTDDFIKVKKQDIQDAQFKEETFRKFLNPADDDESMDASAELDGINQVLRRRIQQNFVSMLQPCGLDYDRKLQCLSSYGKGIGKDNFCCNLSPQKSDFKYVSFEYDTAISQINCMGRATGTKFFLKAKAEAEYQEVFTCGNDTGIRSAEEINAINAFKAAGFTAEQVVLLTMAQNNIEMGIEASVGASSNQYDGKYEVSRAENGDMVVKVTLPLRETVQNYETGEVEFKPIGQTMIHDFVIHPDGTSDCTGLVFVEDQKPEVA